MCFIYAIFVSYWYFYKYHVMNDQHRIPFLLIYCHLELLNVHITYFGRHFEFPWLYQKSRGINHLRFLTGLLEFSYIVSFHRINLVKRSDEINLIVTFFTMWAHHFSEFRNIIWLLISFTVCCFIVVIHIEQLR